MTYCSRHSFRGVCRIGRRPCYCRCAAVASSTPLPPPPRPRSLSLVWSSYSLSTLPSSVCPRTPLAPTMTLSSSTWVRLSTSTGKPSRRCVQRWADTHVTYICLPPIECLLPNSSFYISLLMHVVSQRQMAKTYNTKSAIPQLQQRCSCHRQQAYSLTGRRLSLRPQTDLRPTNCTPLWSAI